MENDILKYRKAVQENILKSFGAEVSEDLLEKAHQDGDMHSNGKWVWRSSANGGKGDWRVADSNASDKKTENKIGSGKKEIEINFYNNDGDKMFVRVYKDGWVKVEDSNVRKDFKNTDEAWNWLKSRGYTKTDKTKRIQ